MKRILIILLFIPMCLYSQTRISIPIDDSLIVLKAHKRAFNEMGKYEVGHNKGEHIRAYMDFIGLPYSKQYPYCCAGVCWSFSYDIPFKKSASTQRLYENIKRIGKKEKLKIEKYNLVIWKKKKKYAGHIGIIDSVGVKGNFWTLEFNTSPNKSQREGDGNYRKKRNLKHIISRMYVRGIIGYKLNKGKAMKKKTAKTVKSNDTVLLNSNIDVALSLRIVLDIDKEFKRTGNRSATAKELSLIVHSLKNKTKKEIDAQK